MHVMPVFVEQGSVIDMTRVKTYPRPSAVYIFTRNFAYENNQLTNTIKL